MSRYLIVNADDLGLSAGVNRGILEAHQRGIVTSTTAMVNLPAAPAGIALMQQEAPGLGIGLHLNLTHGAPVLPAEQVRSLVNEQGTFYSVQAFYNKSKHFDPDELRHEINAQSDRFVELAGCLPDHVDSHHNTTYNHPVVLDAVLKLIAPDHLPVRSGQPSIEVDSLDDIPRLLQIPDLEPHKRALMEAYLANPKPRWPEYTERGFFGETATVDTLLTRLPLLPLGVSEMVCHPGYAYDVEEAYAAPRENELKVLTDPRVREMLEREKITLITFSQMP